MPTKKRRVGFIPRSDVLDLINKLSFESNLSISKIINILVEESLYTRGLFNIKKGRVYNNQEKIYLQNGSQLKMKNNDKNLSNELIKNTDNKYISEASDEFIDKEIYEKFLMFLQFQEKMKEIN